MARKKSARKKTSASARRAPKALPAPASSKDKSEDLLCKISLVMAVFFVMSALPDIGAWVISVRWWVWLVLAIIIGWKPLKRSMNKK